MELNMNLLKEFSAIARDAPVTKPVQSTVNGTVVIDGDPPKTYVKLDGSDNLTPVSTTIQVEDGDRVMVSISGHVATITGNVTAPAVTRVGKMYMEMTADGLAVGLLDDSTGHVTGIHALVNNEGFHIVDNNGNKLSSHKLAELILGGSNASIIKFCNGKGIIKYIIDTLVLSSETAVGFRQPQTGNDRAEVVAKKPTDSAKPQAGLQVIRNNTTVASVIASDTGVDINATGNYETRGGSTAARQVRINGYRVAPYNLMISGTVKSSRAMPASGMRTIEIKVPGLPSDYTLAGIREIRSNHSHMCKITQFQTHPSKNAVSATFVNTGTSAFDDFTVYIEWFALKCSASNYNHSSTNTTIAWNGESNYDGSYPDELIYEEDYVMGGD